MPSKHAGQQFVMRFNPEEKALLERLGKSYGGKKAAVVAGLRALDGRKTMTKAELVAEITRRLK